MTRPRIARRPAYATSWRSNARQAAPIEREAQSDIRAGSTRLTPIVNQCRVVRRRIDGSSSVRLVEVASLEEREVPIVVLDGEVELELVLHDLRGGVALRPRVVGEGEDDELGVLASHGLHPI